MNSMSVGDKVRVIHVPKYKKISDPTWSHQIFEIEQKVYNRYKLKNDAKLCMLDTI
jgi:hypothetical protein